jgi:serine O-acetyltransferase
MSTDIRLKEGLSQITEEVVATYTINNGTHHLGHWPFPSGETVLSILTDVFDILFPGFLRRQNLHLGNVEYYAGDLIHGLHDKLTQQIARALHHDVPPESPPLDFERVAQEKAVEFLKRLPQLRSVLAKDVETAYQGDPAAWSRDEIVFCYPGLKAVAIYRVAHELQVLEVPFIPRMMTEAAHSQTGIDIHPGAQIEPGFFIDHGTGVVIGETCEIGANVKLYQGVTLGALSFPRDDGGNLVRGKKRHPTLQNDVVVYANATILGGDTIIGHHSVIGSNVWLTHGIDPYTVVSLEKPSLRIRGKGDSFDFTPNYQI